MSTVAVVICTYNQRETIVHAVESVLRQTRPPEEVVIVDNGSGDGTPDLLRERFGHLPNVRLMMFDTNLSITRRLNAAISATRSDYVSILYGDDYYLPDKLEKQVDAFAGLGPEYGVVYSPGFRLFVGTGALAVDRTLTSSGHILGELLRADGVFINPISPLMKRRCFEAYPFNEDVFVEGELIFYRFAIDWRFKYIDTPLVVMRDHDTNIGKDVDRNVRIYMKLFDHLEAEQRFPREYLRLVRRLRGRMWAVAAFHALRDREDQRLARECVRHVGRYSPTLFLQRRLIVATVMAHAPRAALRAFNRFRNRTRAVG